MVLESFYADFRPLQVTHQSNFTATLLGRRTKLAGTLSMFVSVTMREIQARDIQAGVDQLVQSPVTVCRRSECRNNFCASLHARNYCTAGTES